MKTIIELFDDEQSNNIALHLYYPEAKIAYIGGKTIMTKARKRALSRFFEVRGCKWMPEFFAIEPYNLSGVISAIEAILKDHPDCLLDLTGGTELALLAMGILSERHHIPMMQVNLQTGALLPVYGVSVEHPPCRPMTLEQLMLLYGGCIVHSDDNELPSSPSLQQIICKLWVLCRNDRTFLNRAATQLNLLANYTNELFIDTCGSELTVNATMRSVIQKLARAGFLNIFSCDTDGIRLTYHSEIVKKLLTKAGMTLEILTRIAAENAGVFTDIRQGITLDWDGIVNQNAAETRNEVDVMLLQGMTPIFVSCKNGDVKKEALYELAVVADRFSGKYAKKVLVCSHLNGSPAANASLRRRAKDMGIVLIENVYAMSLPELSETLVQL